MMHYYLIRKKIVDEDQDKITLKSTNGLLIIFTLFLALSTVNLVYWFLHSSFVDWLTLAFLGVASHFNTIVAVRHNTILLCSAALWVVLFFYFNLILNHVILNKKLGTVYLKKIHKIKKYKLDQDCSLKIISGKAHSGFLFYKGKKQLFYFPEKSEDYARLIDFFKNNGIEEKEEKP